MSAFTTRLIKRLLTERMLIELLVALGDHLVERSDNQLDNSLWWPVRQALTGEAKP